MFQMSQGSGRPFSKSQVLAKTKHKAIKKLITNILRKRAYKQKEKQIPVTSEKATIRTGSNQISKVPEQEKPYQFEQSKSIPIIADMTDTQALILKAMTGLGSYEEEDLVEMLKEATATSTLTNDRALLIRMARDLGPLDKTTPIAVLKWLHSLKVNPRTKAQYARNVLRLATQLSIPNLTGTLLTLAQRAWRNVAPPPCGAVAMQVETYHTLIRNLSIPLVTMAALAFHMASRMDEIRRLTVGMLSWEGEMLYVQHGNQTKTSKRTPDALRFVSCTQLPPHLTNWLKQQTTKAQQQQKIFDDNMHKLLLQKLAALEGGHTQHSFKKGAALIVSYLASEGKIPLKLVPTILKHKADAYEGGIPTQTIAYQSSQSKRQLLDATGMKQAMLQISTFISAGQNVPNCDSTSQPTCQR